MPRTSLFALALLGASPMLAMPAQAQSNDDIGFEIDQRGDESILRLNLRHDDWRDNHSHWNQRIRLDAVQGITAESVRHDGPIAFSYIRPAGRFDCDGRATGGEAQGRCTFTVNEAFRAYLDRQGIERPTKAQFHGLALSGVDSDIIDTLIKEGMGKPSPEQLVGIGVFKITPEFIRGFAHINGMKVSIHDLVQFKIFRITPDSVKAFAALNGQAPSAKDLVKFSIHRVTPDYIRELSALGYRNLSADSLVKMRIFGITPDYISALGKKGEDKLSPDELVKRRIFGIRQVSEGKRWRHQWWWRNDARSSY